MKKLFLLLMMGWAGAGLMAQDLIVTKHSLVFVYNYPDLHFYIQIAGDDKQRTENENVYVLDNKLIQVKVLAGSKFKSGGNAAFSDFMNAYVDWEKSYQEQLMEQKLKSSVDFMKSAAGRDVAFWVYDMPAGDTKVLTDSTTSVSAQKQLFMLTREKEYLIGINSPVFDMQNYENRKQYLLECIDGLVIKPQTIDAEALNKELNNL